MSKKVFRHTFVIEIKSPVANEKAIKHELNEALQHHFSLRNYLTDSRTTLNKIKWIPNGKDT